MEARQAKRLEAIKRFTPSLVILFSVAALTCLGLIALASVTQSHFWGFNALLRKQVLWLFLALVAGSLTAVLDLEKLRPFSWHIAAASGLLLSLVLVPGIGVSVNGARRWLDLGPMNMQVSDFAKIGLVYFLAHYLASNQRDLNTLGKGFLIPAGIIGLVFALILLEPDFGTAFLIAVVGFTLLFLAGIPLLYLFPSALFGFVLFLLAIFMDPVRLRRVVSFLDPEGNRREGGYQLWQAILAFGAGGTEGVGLGNGRQQMAFLPEAHTDFIFPILGEELGFLCTGGIVLLFLLIFLTIIRHSRHAPNLFQFLLVQGALLLITLQGLINFGVVTGCLPTKGISLPFMSYGGSNLVVMFILLGIILNCFRRWSHPPLLNPLSL